jgi:hypothetical protein
MEQQIYGTTCRLILQHIIITRQWDSYINPVKTDKMMGLLHGLPKKPKIME